MCIRDRFYVEQVGEQRLQVYEHELERLQLADVTLVYVEGEYAGKQAVSYTHLDVYKRQWEALVPM